MKRVGNLFHILISDENINEAIDKVNSTHKYQSHHKPNTLTKWIIDTRDDRVKELRQIIIDGFHPKPYHCTTRYDANAKKWRLISEPAQWPDQYVHHMLIQVLKPVMMRGMDYWCCGSIPKRGSKRARVGIQKWMKNDVRGTKWCAEADIHHFYDSISKHQVTDRFTDLVKDPKILYLIYSVCQDGVKIGSYPSQWFANTLLQPLDVKIRKEAKVDHYVRYMDNFTIFASSKRKLRKAIKIINEYLKAHGLSLKDDWQIFESDKRLPRAVGYRYGRSYTLIRKGNLLRLKRQIARYLKRKENGLYISYHLASGLMSRLGQLNHCNCCKIRERYIPKGTMRELKIIIRGGPPWQKNTQLA